MKKIITAVAIVSTLMAIAPKANASGEWGCTIFLCLASPTNPMSIKDCASAILKIRPWKSPTCPAAKVTNVTVKEETAVCPSGFEFFREDFRREVLEDRFGRPRLSDGFCISPKGNIQPSGQYKQSVMEYYDHDGVYRVYRIAY